MRTVKTNHLTLLTAMAAVVLASCLLALVPARSVEAAFPGKNGKIAFVSNRDVGAGEIYTMKPDGTGVTRITFRTGGNSDPAFSPDGTKIAFKRSNDIYLMSANGMNSDGTGAQPITDTPVVESEPSWSPDGTRIAFVASAFEVDGSTDFEIWVMNADGTGRTLLTNNSFSDTQPAWSPDGTKIAFVSARNTGSNPDTDRNVYVMNANGSGQTNITPNTTEDPPYQGNDDDPTWSPDGSKIAYVHTFLPNASGVPNIWTMDPTGANKTNVSSNRDTSAVMPAWSPDGSKIAYVGATDTNRDIWMMNADGTSQGILHANAANDIKPDWQQDSIPPNTTVTSGPASITRSTSASFGFVSSETGSTFRCSLDGAAFTACSSPKSYSGLANGPHTFRVRSTDVAGNTDATAAGRAWRVDTIKPTVSGMRPVPGSIVRDTTPTIKATVRDNMTNLAKGNIKLYVNGKLISATKYSYSASTDLLVYNSPRLAKGKKTVKVVATDAAKNVGAKSWYFTIK